MESRWGFAVVTALAMGWLAGCAAVPSATLIQAAADGASLTITGKSLGGHGLSALTGEDCDFARTLGGEPICREHGLAEAAVTVADGVAEPGRSALSVLYDRVGAGSPPLLATPKAPPYAVVEAPRTYLVVASFATESDARQAARALPWLPAAVSAAPSAGHSYWRVVVGPLDAALAPRLDAELAAAGVRGAFPVVLCAEALTPPPCFSPPIYRPRADATALAAVRAN